MVQEKNELKHKVNELIKWRENLEKNEVKIIDNKLVQIDSKIIKKNEEVEFLIKALTPKGFIKNCTINFNLIYRASRDGGCAEKYHNKCNKKTNTLCLIKTRKACIFGGYTETMVTNGYEKKIDPNAFVFSLNKMKIYDNIKKEENVVIFWKDVGPEFVGAFKVKGDDFFENDVHEVGKKSESNFGIMNEDYELNNGDKNFNVQELEVFEIIIE